MKKATLAVLVVILGFMAMRGAQADEVLDTIESAKKLYQEKKYSDASGELQFAVNQIQNLQAEELRKLLPDPEPGWTAEEATGSTGAMGLFGGGVSVSKRYTKKDTRESVEAQIMTESPLLQSAMMFLTNPAMLAGQAGAKLVRVKGEKAVEKFSAKNKRGELSLVLGGKTLIMVKGSNITDKNVLHKYLEKIDFAAITKATGG